MRENDRICKPLHKIFQNTGIWSHLVILLKIRHIWSHLVRFTEEILNGKRYFLCSVYVFILRISLISSPKIFWKLHSFSIKGVSNTLTLIWVGFLGVCFAVRGEVLKLSPCLKLVRIMLETQNYDTWVHNHMWFQELYLLIPGLF